MKTKIESINLLRKRGNKLQKLNYGLVDLAQY
jgi:hypothetical protein